MTNIRPEIKTLLFFAAYFIAFILIKTFQPHGSPHAPNISDIFFLLSIPASIIYSLFLLYKFFKSGNRNYVNAIFVVTALWVIFYNLLKYVIY
ncbi:glucan phosphoethanolaminetransferase (alkaline phosphatase superfamily) [Flavobacterium sp. HSC-32F16]|nr:glucan phosphoethanolaminetransferase (alkaline phosphatase superfamily) [Flavobacterium sp. HSC-32F16]